MTQIPIAYQLDCPATELGVRSVLARPRSAMADRCVGEETQISVEIAVAEALNNIVEHALSGQPHAKIDVDLSIDAAQVRVLLTDCGLAMPDTHAGPKSMPNLGVARDDLPEGGFGSALMHALTDQLEFNRVSEMNRLQMWFAVNDGENVIAPV